MCGLLGGALGGQKVTLGPKGRNVVLDKEFGSPAITNDGVAIAKEIELPNTFENMIAQVVNEVTSKTNDIAGDGTTTATATATVLAQAIIREGLRNVTAGSKPLLIKRASNPLLIKRASIRPKLDGRARSRRAASRRSPPRKMRRP